MHTYRICQLWCFILKIDQILSFHFTLLMAQAQNRPDAKTIAAGCQWRCAGANDKSVNMGTERKLAPLRDFAALSCPAFIIVYMTKCRCLKSVCVWMEVAKISPEFGHPQNSHSLRPLRFLGCMTHLITPEMLSLD